MINTWATQGKEIIYQDLKEVFHYENKRFPNEAMWNIWHRGLFLHDTGTNFIAKQVPLRFGK